MCILHVHKETVIWFETAKFVWFCFCYFRQWITEKYLNFHIKVKMWMWNQLQVIWYQTAICQWIVIFIAQLIAFSKRHCLLSTQSSEGEYKFFYFVWNFLSNFRKKIIKMHIWSHYQTKCVEKQKTSFFFHIKPIYYLLSSECSFWSYHSPSILFRNKIFYVINNSRVMKL